MESILASNPMFRSRPTGFNTFACQIRAEIESEISQSLSNESVTHSLNHSITDGKSSKQSINQKVANEMVKRWYRLSDNDRDLYRVLEETNTAILSLVDFDQSVDSDMPETLEITTPNQSINQSATRTHDDEDEYYINTKDQSIHSTKADSANGDSGHSDLSSNQSINQSLHYDPLNLNNIRETLIRLEESIIFALIERAQFKINRVVYQSINHSNNPFGDTFNGLSFLHYFLYETERLHSKIRRYTSPDEHPFCHPSLFPPPILPPLVYPPTLKPQSINLNATIDAWYEVEVLPAICSEGDDGNYGSSALADTTCLQLLSKRIHYGKFVAEAKFRMEPQVFSDAIRACDTDKLMQLITKPLVEEQVIQRVHRKAMTYGTAPDINASPHIGPGDQSINQPTPLSLPPSSTSSVTASQLNWSVVAQQTQEHSKNKSKYKISPDVIAQIYLNVIELNKQVQIQYLLQRLD